LRITSILFGDLMKKFRRGLTGIETAIILIAFVIVAAAFAFAILNVGFQTTEKSQSVITEGMLQASSSIDLVGAVIAEDCYNVTWTGPNANGQYNVTSIANQPDGVVDIIRFTIKLSPGMTPVDLNPGKLVLSWTDKDQYLVNIYPKSNNNDLANVKSYGGVYIKALTPNDNDLILKPGEKYEVIIYVHPVENLTNIPGTSIVMNSTLEAYDEFKIEIKPEKGSVLTIERMLPAKIEPEMFLGVIGLDWFTSLISNVLDILKLYA